MWESNPPAPRERREPGGFEVRGGHQPSCASAAIIAAVRPCRKAAAALALAAVALLATGCGVKKDPVAPLRRVPMPPELTAMQEGDRAVLRGTLSTRMENGDAFGKGTLHILRSERKAGGMTAPTANIFLKEASTAAEIPVEPRRRAAFEWSEPLPPLPEPLPAEEGKPAKTVPPPVVYYAAELRGEKKGRRSPLSKILTLTVKPYTPPPAAVRLEPSEKSIRLLWDAVATPAGAPEGKAVRYWVFRSEDGGPPRRVQEQAQEGLSYEDMEFQFGHHYRYVLRSQLEGWAESSDSEAVEVLMKDVFPPAVPAGFTASVEDHSIRLFWFPNEEPDLNGYVLERRVEEGDWTPVAEMPLKETVYLDEALETGRRYFYRLRALDRSGNMSAFTGEVERMLRGE